MVLNCKKIGFINGCFDILHPGHLKMIQYCRKYCDYLIVGIDSDRMVKKSKGALRPFNNEKDRKFFLENIKGVDKVFIFNSHKLLKEKLKKLKPDIMIVGAEYKDKKVIGSEHAKELKFFEKVDGYSTTKIIQDIIDRR
jgi:D-beta-D-heptose 7-phosphate kinase/D-beta-D-heptose 1-phosphate adenosyltransferase